MASLGYKSSENPLISPNQTRPYSIFFLKNVGPLPSLSFFSSSSLLFTDSLLPSIFFVSPPARFKRRRPSGDSGDLRHFIPSSSSPKSLSPLFFFLFLPQPNPSPPSFLLSFNLAFLCRSSPSCSGELELDRPRFLLVVLPHFSGVFGFVLDGGRRRELPL